MVSSDAGKSMITFDWNWELDKFARIAELMRLWISVLTFATGMISTKVFASYFEMVE